MSVRGLFLTSLIVLTALTGAFAQLPGRYTRYSQALQTLDSLEALYPGICRLDTMGFSSRDSVPMLRFKISDNVGVEEDEPAVFYCGGVHADEVLGVEVVMWFVKDIMTKYSQQDPATVRYVDSLEIFCIPVTNPEGHLVVEQGQTDWRKNKFDNDNNGVFDFHDGVDNNRNYDFGWSIDDAPDAIVPESLQYKGTAPFTQSENIAMAAFAWRYRPVVAVDYHSPTYGRPEVAYYPWYWYANVGGHGMAPDEAMMLGICRQFCSRIANDDGDSSYEARRGLVDKGDFKTFFYGNFGTVAFSCEISDTTIQDTSIVDSICNRHLPAQYYLLGRALGSAVTGVIRDSVTLEPIEAEVQVLERINADIRPRLSRPDNGRYRRILDPATYSLRVIKAGYYTRNITGVVVPSGRPVTVDVLLRPVNPRPPAPALVFPPRDTTLGEMPVTFTWRSASYAQRYQIELYGDAQMTTPLYIDSLVTDTTATPSFQPSDTLIYWRVRGGNNYGWGPFSQLRSFVLNSVPTAPALAYPANGGLVADSVLAFVWRPAAFADRYLIEVYTDSALTTPLYIDSTATDTQTVAGVAAPDMMAYWRVKAGNELGWGPYSPTWSFLFDQLSNLGESPLPRTVVLAQNYPNPFNAATAIAVELPPGTEGNLSIFDIVGRVVREYSLTGAPRPGTQHVIWDARDFSGEPVSSGVYFYRLRAGDSNLTKKMILLR